ncbi:copper resistance protein B [Limnobacter litoralis]|uniref:Copper resistance protein B n=1 Tax=Limnobacter litoralis TaxID=481366 RepID=A0ABQ5YKX3_9BURK|nr:copper resistance protein B [Limnobacter litoralis]GLR25188.1 copper resistance protein B [Limnobacter litoralis]
MTKPAKKILISILSLLGTATANAAEHGMTMNMQGGDAPADARNTDDYSGGYTLGTGPYLYSKNAGQSARKMEDSGNIGSFLADRLERAQSSENTITAWDLQAWIGNQHDKATIKAEGDYSKGHVGEERTEGLWSHAVSTYWDTQLGIRLDNGRNRPSREWLAFGVQGLAPYWFDVEATGYIGPEGRTAARVQASYDLLLTQKLILQPRIDANVYSKSDPQANIGNGLTDATLGIRLRYEITRQFAPYIGLERAKLFGSSADLVQAAGDRRLETRIVAGVRLWF